MFSINLKGIYRDKTNLDRHRQTKETNSMFLEMSAELSTAQIFLGAQDGPATFGTLLSDMDRHET